jgi:D-proline reductase (dithiol) PrdB
VLARTLEAAGLSTLLITPMPYWAERVGTPRTLAVEYPFGHALGLPGEPAMQQQILAEAFEALEKIKDPGTVMHSPQQWPGSVEQAIQLWQPLEPSPIITALTPKFREMLRKRRKT